MPVDWGLQLGYVFDFITISIYQISKSLRLNTLFLLKLNLVFKCLLEATMWSLLFYCFVMYILQNDTKTNKFSWSFLSFNEKS